MIEETCLICTNTCSNYKNWYEHKILICDDCSFSYIKKNKAKINEVFSISDKAFYDRSIVRYKERRELFLQKIVKNRISIYEKILKKKPLNILEIGCGTGVIADGFSQNGIEYFGIELDKNMYDFARKKSKNIFYGDFLNTNFKKKFDVLFASQVVEHIDEPNIFFKKCNDVLEKNGILHVDVPNDGSMVSFLRKIFKNKKYHGAIRPPYHMRAYSLKSLNKLFLRNNFYNIKTFSKFNLDRTYGQIVETIPLKIALMFRLQQLTGMNSLLIGMAQKK